MQKTIAWREMDTQLHFRVSQKAKWESKQSKTFEKKNKTRKGREENA